MGTIHWIELQINIPYKSTAPKKDIQNHVSKIT